MPDVFATDGPFPSAGANWLALSADGSAAATPPDQPGGAGTPPAGAVGLEQSFRAPAGFTRLAFDAAFLLAGPAASDLFNDFVSVDVTDGVTSVNLLYLDSFATFPRTSAESGLPLTDRVAVDADLAQLFPGSDDTTLFTLSLAVGNGGDGGDSSLAYFDDFRLLEGAPDVRRIGCGVNPIGSLTLISGQPRLGETLVFGLDNPLGTQGPARPVLLFSFDPDVQYPCGTPVDGWGMAGGAGELLVDLTPPNPVRTLQGPEWTTPGVPAEIAFQVPLLPDLVGAKVYVQGYLVDNARTYGIRIGLTDGLELTLRD